MTKLSKRMRMVSEKTALDKQYTIEEAVSLLAEMATTKFKESYDLAVKLGIDARKSDQVVRGAVALPHGTGKEVRVAVFAGDELADEAKKAGAEKVGMGDLADHIKAGNFDFDVIIATPDAMRMVATLGQVLGPKGLMPNPKMGTVTAEIGAAVAVAKSGQMRYRADRGGIVHGSVGRVGFDVAAIKENVEAVLADLKKAKPVSAKGVYFQNVTLSTTMGAGLAVDQASLSL